MTSTKKKFNSKVFTVAIVLVIVLSWIISPLATIGASAATVSGSPTLFSGYGYGKSDEYIHNITRLDSPSEDSPSVTILVHGQGGEASHWSNDTSYDFAYDPSPLIFAYDPSSLIETLRSIAPNSEVLWARMKNKTQFYLTRLDRGNYNLDVNKQEYLTTIEDVSKHTIIVFESSNADSYHRDVYQ